MAVQEQKLQQATKPVPVARAAGAGGAAAAALASQRPTQFEMFCPNVREIRGRDRETERAIKIKRGEGVGGWKRRGPAGGEETEASLILLASCTLLLYNEESCCT